MDNIDRASDSIRAESNTHDAQPVRLADGAQVWLRVASRDGHDATAFRRLFFSLSETTRYLYFGAGIPPTETWAERFAALGHADGIRSFVLVAESGGDLIGFARFGRHPGMDPQTMDIGVLLTDAWQGRGLGSHLLGRLATEAYQRTITRFTAVALWENRRVLRLAHRLFPDMRIACAHGSCELTIDLDDSTLFLR